MALVSLSGKMAMFIMVIIESLIGPYQFYKVHGVMIKCMEEESFVITQAITWNHIFMRILLKVLGA